MTGLVRPIATTKQLYAVFEILAFYKKFPAM
jgi:hypothetical protein